MIGHYSQLAHQGISDPSRSMANGGGSGGGGSSNPDTRYANLDTLYGTQNQASQFMLNNAMPHVPGLTDNSAQMVSDAMDGTLGNQMRDQAGNNAQATFGAALDSNSRNMQRYGMGMNTNRIMSENNRNAIMGASMKAGEMNRAGAMAEDMKWNRNAGMFGQVMGMNNGAMAGMSSAGAGMANTANQMNANDMANAKGYGQAGAAFGNALFKADGGYIRRPARLAAGGDAWTAYKAANPVKPMGSSGGGRGRTSAAGSIMAGFAPYAAAGLVKDVFKGKDGVIGKGFSSTYKYFNKPSESVDAVNPEADAISDWYNANEGMLTSAEVGTQVGTEVGTQVGTEVGTQVGTEVGTQAGSEIGSSVASDPSIWESVGGLLNMAEGGSVRKPQKFAIGGMAQSSVASSNKVDNVATPASLDASAAMQVSKMGTSSPVNKMETHAKPVVDTMYSGKTDGRGESSDGDPDGFGVHSGDNRHMAGKATMQVIGNWLGPKFGGVIGGALAEVLHPVGEAVSRTVISAGDKVGGPGGALVLDPIGTTMSGKYSNEELAKGHASVALGMPWLSKFADGGRVDHTDGGDVQGPGTETSDSIPAQLSDGEYVLNAEAVKLVGKDKLEAINNKGLAIRESKGESVPEQGGAIKLAGGGFLGGNLGVAMGAGVEQMNAQQAIDQRQQSIDLAKAADARQAEQQKWAALDQDEKIRQRTAEDALVAKYKPMLEANAKGDSSWAGGMVEQYNSNQGMFADNKMMRPVQTEKGTVIEHLDADGNVVNTTPFTQQTADKMLRHAFMAERAGISSKHFDEYSSYLDNNDKSAREDRKISNEDRYRQRYVDVLEKTRTDATNARKEAYTERAEDKRIAREDQQEFEGKKHDFARLKSYFSDHESTDKNLEATLKRIETTELDPERRAAASSKAYADADAAKSHYSVGVKAFGAGASPEQSKVIADAVVKKQYNFNAEGKAYIPTEDGRGIMLTGIVPDKKVAKPKAIEDKPKAQAPAAAAPKQAITAAPAVPDVQPTKVAFGSKEAKLEQDRIEAIRTEKRNAAQAETDAAAKAAAEKRKARNAANAETAEAIRLANSRR